MGHLKTCQQLVFNSAIDESEPCGNIVEGNTDMCASHNAFFRKMKKQNDKAVEKRVQQIERQKEKNKIARKTPNKVSAHQKARNEVYSQMRTDFLRMTKECEAKVNEYCTNKPETIHHKRGRGKYLLAPETWLPCCMSCHVWIENHPKESKERGFSESRLATTEPHKI